ncbi:hypothetical protein GCM10010156_54240 [Planobispora rosea]|uniref:Lipoprotein n=1 Tax=Planobispora rosea TaxID=35762 RepID=A0A8J3S4P9_PLARO|nr:hypothetical protein [Planobispora rosea]GGS88937.1 hypothetical protein GCM10010156_54240 [Planobispora rosea]GIH87802.1 hypothetical protein Pro02_62100 [Planobispora rosea]
MRSRSLPAALLVLAVSGCQADPSPPAGAGAAPTSTVPGSASPGGVTPDFGSATPDPAAKLRRPWPDSRLGPGERCPVTTGTTRPDPELGPLLGTGRVGPVGVGPNGRLEYEHPDVGNLTDRSWGARKVLWAVDPGLDTLVLVRGRRLDGPGEVAFNDPAAPELLLDPAEDAKPGGWRDHPSFTRLRAPGCYAYRVDTEAGSFTLVFRAAGPVVGPSG